METHEGIASGRDLTVLIRAYFDESAEEKVGKGYLTVAGYVFDDEGFRGLQDKWKGMLDVYELPYFHMTECNVDDPQPPNVFAHLSKPKRIEAATDAIAIAREYPLHGAGYVVRQEDYQEVLMDGGFDCDAYSFLLWTALLQVAKWCVANKPNQPLALFFEQGYKSRSRADELLQYVIQDQAVWRNKGRPPAISHEFFDKDASYSGQAADLLAWHVRKGNANAFAGRPIRKDTLALIEDRKVWTVHYTRERLAEIKNHFIEKSGSLARASQILFTPNDPFLGERATEPT